MFLFDINYFSNILQSYTHCEILMKRSLNNGNTNQSFLKRTYKGMKCYNYTLYLTKNNCITTSISIVCVFLD